MSNVKPDTVSNEVRRYNNFNLIRLVAAGFVIYSHSYALVGITEPLFFRYITFGSAGVYIFFVVSGYLIIQSWDRDPHPFRYFVRRSLRIFPGLAVCIAMCTFVLGSMITTLSLSDYITHDVTWQYLKNTILLVQYHLPGVFYDNPHKYAVNGALWSLPIEFCMYIALPIIAYFLNCIWTFFFVAIASSIVTISWALNPGSEALVFLGSDVRMLFICGTYFWFGALFYKTITISTISMSVLLVLAVLSTVIMTMLSFTSPYLLHYATWILLPIILIWFGETKCPNILKPIAQFDISYGLYIYAFPIQQTFVHLIPDITAIQLCTITLICACCAGAISWKFVEKPCLSCKPTARPM